MIAPARPDAAVERVAGEVITLATRLKEQAGPNEILVGDRTREAAGDRYRFSGPAASRARRLLGRARRRDGEPAWTPLVGRRSELIALAEQAPA